MKVVILCGGKGSRLGQLTETTPKPMVSIGSHPIIWHIINIYKSQGFNDFILALGYKSSIIKNFFLNSDIILKNKNIDLESGVIELKNVFGSGVNITLFETGLNTMTGGRVLRLKKYLKNSTFMLTYGDGLANVILSKLHKFHIKHNKMVTVTAVRPIARFGELKIFKNEVKNFKEKPQTTNGWINGGFFIIEPNFIELIEGDKTILESGPLEEASKKGQLMAYKHKDFWYCMDTVRDKDELELMWKENRAPWKR